MSVDKQIIGLATVYCGDCLEVIESLNAAGAIISDPPYGIAFSHGGNDCSGFGGGKYKTAFAKVKITGDDAAFDPSWMVRMEIPTILWGANHFAKLLPNQPSWLIWDKRSASGHTNDFADCEIAWSNTGKVARVFRHHWDGMMKASEQGLPRHHPTQKPIALMKWCIEQLGVPKIIADPYMGCGSTGIAAVEMGLQFIGVEIDRKYFDIACERIENAQRQMRMFA